MESLSPPTNPTPSKQSLWLNLRLALAAILLFPAIWFSWKTIDCLAQRRLIRTDLAEITNARYGILSADQWRGIIGPILNAQVDKLDLKGQTKNLRPMVEQSLNNLLDHIKTQMTAPAAGGSSLPAAKGSSPPAAKGAGQPSAKGTGPPAAANPFIVNMIVGSLRPHIPEYTDVVMAQLGKQQTQQNFKDSVRIVLADAVKNTFGATDMTTYNTILNRYGCAQTTTGAAACEEILAKKISEADSNANRDYLTVLASAALGFILLIPGKLTRAAVAVLMLFCIAMLAGGVLSPMLEVEVRVTKLDATLLGAPIEFRDQSLYYRSKTVLEVCQTLIAMGQPEMTLVGVLVILFSIVFPVLKMLALCAGLIQPALLRTNRLVRLLAFELSKWSMADVMVLAIFMSFVAFNGVVGGALDGLRSMPGIQQVSFPTSASKILPGYYLFIGFCLSSIILSKKLERGIASNAQTP